jgi:GntR family transcriptional regulator
MRKKQYVIVTEQLRNIITNEFQQGQKLPSEMELAQQLGVSRMTLREGLRSLENEGLIQRFHGVGCFVTKNRGHIVSGIEKLQSFIESIREAGCSAEERILGIDKVVLDAQMAKKLQVAEGSIGYKFKILRLADGVPVIYAEDIIPESIIPQQDLVNKRYNYESMMNFLREVVGKEVEYAFVSIKAVLSGEYLARIMEIEDTMPLILMAGEGCDSFDKPLYHSKAYFRCDKYEFTVLRKK